MAADEDQPQTLVGDGSRLVGELVFRVGLGLRRIRRQPAAHAAGADLVQRRAPGDAIEPRRRIRRLARLRPASRRRQAGFAKGVLGQVEVAQAGGEGADHPPRRRPRRPVERAAQPAALRSP